jgi:hypothetical protein
MDKATPMTYFANRSEMKANAAKLLRVIIPAAVFAISSQYWRHAPVQAADASAALHDQLVAEVAKVTFPQKVNGVMSVTGTKVDGLHLTFSYSLKSASQFNDQLKDAWTKNACSGDSRALMAQGASYRYEYFTDGAFVGEFDIACGNT